MNYTEAVEYIYRVPKFTTKKQAGAYDGIYEAVRASGTEPKDHPCGRHQWKGIRLRLLVLHAGSSRKANRSFHLPHLVKINERFQINNVPVGDEEFLEAYQKVDTVIREMVTDGLPHPTYFELLFATAMVLFERENVEYVVLETGLGGRLDATNTVEKPLATVITSISLDHTEILGDTIGKIAFEKAGIIKPGVPVIYDGSVKEAEEVILKRAGELGSPAYALYPSMYKVLEKTDKSIDFSLNCKYYENVRVEVPYLADYQMMNSSLALLTLAVVDEKGEIPLKTRLAGIRDTRWEGRMETVLPGVVLDGAHNAAGIREFIRTVQQIEGSRRGGDAFFRCGREKL